MIAPVRAATTVAAPRPLPRAGALDAAVLGQERPEVPRLADLARRLKAGEKPSPEPFAQALRSPDPVQRRAADLLLYDLSYDALPMEARPALRGQGLYDRLHQFLAACAESDWPLKPDEVQAVLQDLQGLQGPVPPDVLKATVHLAHELHNRAEAARPTTGFRIRELEAPDLDRTWATAMAQQAQRWAEDGRLQTSLDLATAALATRLVVDGATVSAPAARPQHPPEIAALAAEVAKDLNHYECSGGVQKGRQLLNDLAGTDFAKAERVVAALVDSLDLLHKDRDLGALGTLLEDAVKEAGTLPHLAPLLRTRLPRLLKFPEEAERVGRLAPRRSESVPYYRARFYGAVLDLAGPQADRATVLDQLVRMTRQGYRWDREMPEHAAALFTRLARQDATYVEPLARLVLQAMPTTGGSKAEWEHLHAAVTAGWKPTGEDLEALAARLYMPPESSNRWAEEDFLRALQTLAPLDVSALRLPGRDGQPVTLGRHVAERLLFQEDSPGNLHVPPHADHRPEVLARIHDFCLGDAAARELLVEQAPTNPRAVQLLGSRPLSDDEAARLEPQYREALRRPANDAALGALLDELRRRSADPAVQLLRHSGHRPSTLPPALLQELRTQFAPTAPDHAATARVAAARLEDRPARDWTAQELLDLRSAHPDTLLDRLTERLLEPSDALTPGAVAVLAPWQEALWSRTLAGMPGAGPVELVDRVERAAALLRRPGLDLEPEPLLAAFAQETGLPPTDWAFEVYRTLIRVTPDQASFSGDLLERLGDGTRESRELLTLATERVAQGHPWEIALLHARAQQKGLPLPEETTGEAGAIETRGATVSIGGIELDVRR